MPPPYDTPFLAPGADLLNHGPYARTGWTLSAVAGRLCGGVLHAHVLLRGKAAHPRRELPAGGGGLVRWQRRL